MATIADLLIKLGIRDDATRQLGTFERKTDEAGEHTKAFGSVAREVHEGIIKSLGNVAKVAGITGATFEAGEFVKGGVEAAEGLQKANESLESSIAKTGGSAEELMPKFRGVAKAAADYGVSQKDATKEMASAVLMTGNAEAGMRAYQEAILLSKGAHISLDAALRATAKGQDGVLSGLTRYGVVLKQGTTGVQQLAAIQKVWGGQAEANTLDSDRLNAKFQNMQASLGGFLLPYFLKFTVYMGDVIDGMVSLAGWVGKNSDIIAPLAAAIGAVVVAFVAWRAATAAWTAATELATSAQIALDAAMDANPIGLVILAIVGLGAALAVLWVKSESFRKAVEATWTTLKTTTVNVWNAIKDFIVKWWPLLLAAVTGGMSLVVAAVLDHWTAIKSDTVAVWNTLSGIVTGAVGAVRTAAVTGFDAVRTAVVTPVNAVRAAVAAVFGALGGIVKAAIGGVSAGVAGIVGAFHGVIDVLSDIVNGAEAAFDAIEKVAGVVGKIGGVGDKVLHALHVPGFATGVRNFGGGLAIVGEDGPELVSLPSGSSVYTNAESRGMVGGVTSAGGGDGDVILQVDGRELIRFARQELNRTGTRNARPAIA